MSARVCTCFSLGRWFNPSDTRAHLDQWSAGNTGLSPCECRRNVINGCSLLACSQRCGRVLSSHLILFARNDSVILNLQVRLKAKANVLDTISGPKSHGARELVLLKPPYQSQYPASDSTRLDERVDDFEHTLSNSEPLSCAFRQVCSRLLAAIKCTHFRDNLYRPLCS